MNEKVQPIAQARVAWVAHGGLVKRGDGQYVPALVSLFEHLSRRFSVDRVCFGNPSESLPGVERVAPQRHVFAQIWGLKQRLIRMHRQQPLSLIHGIWGYPGGAAAVWAARSLGIPCVVTFNGFEPACLPDIGYGGQLTWWSRRLLKWVCRHADMIVFPSQDQKARTLGCVGTMDRNSVVSYGIPWQQFEGPVRIPHQPLRVLSVGSVNRVKDYLTLLEAVLQVSQTVPLEWRIVGGAVERDVVQKLTSHPFVDWVAEVLPDRMPEHYKWADLLLHGSRHESQGVVFVEAGAAGIPIAGTRVGLLRDWSEWLPTCEPRDVAGLAELIVELSGDAQQVKQITTRIQDQTKQLTVVAAGQAYEKIYSMLLSRE